MALLTLCPACREPVNGSGLCASCWAKLSLIAPPYCERLGIPFAYDPGPGALSMQAIADPPAYHRARAGRELLAEADHLVPVPLHWRRLWARRFNQSALLAKTMAQETGVRVAEGVLKRVKPPPSRSACRRPSAP